MHQITSDVGLHEVKLESDAEFFAECVKFDRSVICHVLL